MYLSNIKLWNFRRYGLDGELDLKHPNLDLAFNKGMGKLTVAFYNYHRYLGLSVLCLYLNICIFIV